MLEVLQERRRYLAKRIKAKREMGWEYQWDQREHDALSEAIQRLEELDGKEA